MAGRGKGFRVVCTVCAMGVETNGTARQGQGQRRAGNRGSGTSGVYWGVSGDGADHALDRMTSPRVASAWALCLMSDASRVHRGTGRSTRHRLFASPASLTCGSPDGCVQCIDTSVCVLLCCLKSTRCHCRSVLSDSRSSRSIHNSEWFIQSNTV
jgi:hypothetical protein